MAEETQAVNGMHTGADYSRVLGMLSEREAKAERSAASWRQIALVLGVLALGLLGLYGYQRQQSTVEPYLVGVTEDGRVLVLGKPRGGWQLEEIWVRRQVSAWIQAVRSLSTDEVAVKQQRTDAWRMMMEPGSTQLRTHFAALPMSRVGQLAIAVQVQRVVPPVSGSTWEVQWSEERTEINSRATTRRNFTGFVTLVIKKPVIQTTGTMPAAEAEHLGIFVQSFSLEERP